MADRDEHNGGAMTAADPRYSRQEDERRRAMLGEGWAGTGPSNAYGGRVPVPGSPVNEAGIGYKRTYADARTALLDLAKRHSEEASELEALAAILPSDLSRLSPAADLALWRLVQHASTR